jgi:hypothetical protein
MRHDADAVLGFGREHHRVKSYLRGRRNGTTHVFDLVADLDLGTQTGRMTNEITFKVEGRPPAKSVSSIFRPDHPHAPRVLALLGAARQEAERRSFQGFGSMPIGLELRVACGRDQSRSDATNYLGGVGDVLDDKARRTNLGHLGNLASFGLYCDDRQIEEVHFHWELSQRLSYTVRLWGLDLTRARLKAEGFVGWVHFKQMLNQDRVPRTAGIYVIARSTTGDPNFLDATVPEELLRAKWVPGAEIVYVGKADELRQRLFQFADSRPGKRGGRLIWQLEESKNLLVAWKKTSGLEPRPAEAAVLAEFRKRYGKPPFANEPHRLGA